MHTLHRVRTAALLALALTIPAAPAPAQAPELAGLDAYIRTAMADWEIPGLSLAVVRNDSVIYARGFGERTLGTGEPVDAHTLFAIASTTKAMTVAALGMLVDDSVIDWDDPVAKHLPSLQLGDAYLTRHLTIRDLLTHRTGLDRQDNIWIAAPFERPEILRRARHLEQAEGFRTGYRYNNLMYMVAGEVVGSASGMPWETFIENRLFAPLGMTRSTPRTAVVARRENVASSHTRVDGRVRAVPRRDYDALGPAGSVFSSASEMAEWVRLHLAHGVHDGRRLLDSATVEEMHTPQVVVGIDSVTRRLFPDRNFRAYGLGWRLYDYRGRKMVEHTGNVNYTRTQVGMIPSEGIGVVAFANLSSSGLQIALMHRVFDALLGLPERDWSAEYLALNRRSSARSEERREELEASRVKGTRPSLPLEDYAGTYTDSLYGELRIEREGRGLVLRYAEPHYVADLEHWHHDTFRAVWRRPGFGRSFVTFTLDPRARAKAVDLQGFTMFTRR
ncbi:MAG: serine hydrolase [Gemmatimonadetes bacterium]|nr:serine hydrolase [Gemmatimonadota bacterium]